MIVALSIVGGLVILTLGADWLVKGASRLALSFGIPSLVVGLTVVAFGTSAPEMTVSALASFQGDSGIAIGNVIGSNIFNILFILGISALITPLLVHKQLIKIDVPIMIVASLLFWFFSNDGVIKAYEALVLFVALLSYLYFLIKLSKKDNKIDMDLPSKKEIRSPRWISLLWILVGLLALVGGSKLFVDGAVVLARALGVSELIIGLTIVAAGTSLPEVATSVMAAFRGERDIAVGNVVGSSIFNVLGVIGLSGLLSSSGLSVDPEAQAFDIPVMVAVSVACLPIFFTGSVIKRWEGFVFLMYYIFYTFFIILVASKSTYIENYKYSIAYFVIPLTILTLLVAVSRSLYKKRSPL